MWGWCQKDGKRLGGLCACFHFARLPHNPGCTNFRDQWVGFRYVVSHFLRKSSNIIFSCRLTYRTFATTSYQMVPLVPPGWGRMAVPTPALSPHWPQHPLAMPCDNKPPESGQQPPCGCAQVACGTHTLSSARGDPLGKEHWWCSHPPSLATEKGR